MEMWLRQATLVLLAAAMAVSAPSVLKLDVIPTQTHLSVGSCVTLSCCGNKFDKFWVEWAFNPNESSFKGSENLTKYYSSSKKSTEAAQQQRCPQDGQQGRRCTELLAEYTILNASQNHTGWYFCNVKVNVPVHKENHSNGTQIVVMNTLTEHPAFPSLTKISEREPTETPPIFSWWIWIIVGVSGFVLLVVLVVCIAVRGRSRTDAEDPIYTNTHPRRPSPHAPVAMDNLKTASSYQNLRTPSPGRRYDEDRRRYRL